MAHIEVWCRCPTCQRLYFKEKEALVCKNSHSIRFERWAVGKTGKAVKINEHCSGIYGEKWALKEADMGDFNSERKEQYRG
ncbi:MAG: hypothetical protein WC364_04830 [Eubacteriales bacterium]|jgi:hypothetical protein